MPKIQKIQGAGILVALFALLLLPFSVSEAFTDTSNHRNEEAIDYLYDLGVVEGYSDGSFGPNNSINRAEFVKILMESRYPSEDEGFNCFPDVKTEWFAPYVCTAEDRGIVNGYQDGYFRPTNDVNLAEALKIVLETYDVEFTQYSSNWLWYIPYHRTAEDLDLLNDISNDIDGNVTRGEMAQLILNVETYLEESDDTDDEDEEDDHDHDHDDSDDDASSELSFDDDESASAIPNVVILEFEEDNEWRNSNGNVDMEGAVEAFYDIHDDDFDILLAIAPNERYQGLRNGITNGAIHRYGPSNIGNSTIESSTEGGAHYCSMKDNTTCEGFPERLRYIQSTGDNYSGYIFKHEIGHYWSADWHESKNGSCYDEWMQDGIYNGHWTKLAVLGETTSPVSVSTSSVDDGDTAYGEFYDNGDGTFTNVSYSGGVSSVVDSVADNQKISDLKFNVMDLYAMGLIDENDVDDEEMYVITDPEFVSWDSDGKETLITGNRVDLELDDFKDLLLTKESCEETGEGIYYTGNGDRETHPDDPNPDFAENPHVGIFLIKFPDEPIPMSTAYQICQTVNYEWPAYWEDATYGLSELDISIDGDEQNPDCADLFAE